ncbi:MAG: MBL fold metallo-hydrolase [Anaerolineae bacterium]|nr:MBL fold metallo-hydrolase [Anaerolineae bacterium]
MQVTTHGDYLVQLTRYIAFNCFLVREADGFTLIDTNMSGSAKGILQAAQALNAPIRRIVITHAHVDHVGSLDALHALLPEAEVAISARDARFLKGDRSLDPDEPQVPLRGGYTECTTVPTRLLNGGDTVGSLEVIASPGHTPGHVAYFDRRDGTLIAGDAYSTQAGIVTGGSLRLLFPFHALATWHKPTTLHSAEVLRDLRPTRLAVGHGRTLEDPVPAMNRAIAEAKRHLENDPHATQKAY